VKHHSIAVDYGSVALDLCIESVHYVAMPKDYWWGLVHRRGSRMSCAYESGFFDGAFGVLLSLAAV